MDKEFLKNLDGDEELLYSGFACVTKTDKQILNFVMGIVLLIIFWLLFFMGLRNSHGLKFELIVMLIVLVIISISFLYGFFYNICLKYRSKNNQYFVTNKRIAVNNPKIGIRIEDISSIERIGIIRERDNYGDMVFNFYSENILNSMRNSMSFEGVEYPRRVLEIIKGINSNIYVYDDKPKGVMSKDR